MSLTYEECTFIIKQFREVHPTIMMSRNVHGLQVAFVDEPVLQLVVTSKIERSKLPSDEIMLNSFIYNYNGSQRNIRAEVITAKILLPHGKQLKIDDSLPASKAGNESARGVGVRAGDTATATVLSGFGTAGWSFILNNVPVCLSNFHVLCGYGNDTPIGSRVNLKGQNIASLFVFQPITFGWVANTWDYALARYDNINDALGEMRKCQDGVVYPYPQKLSQDVRVGGEQTYHKAGAREPICRSGRLIAIGDRLVGPYKMAGNQNAWFTGQLIFTIMSRSGDSGSVVIRDSDNTCTGLIFAGDDETETIANPLFRNPWEYVGSLKLEKSSTELPVFSGPPIHLLADSNVISTEFSFEVDENTTPFDLPKFAAGKVFLGVAVGTVHILELNVVRRWRIPPPAPVREGVPVETVMIYEDVKYGGNPKGGFYTDGSDLREMRFMCFG